MAPYLVTFVTHQLKQQWAHPPALQQLLSATSALLRNESLALDPYLHQLLPALLSCVLAKSIGVRLQGVSGASSG